MQCKKCSACLNPYARVDYRMKVWVCPFCFNRNNLPQHYQGIDENKLPVRFYTTAATLALAGAENTPPPLSNQHAM